MAQPIDPVALEAAGAALSAAHAAWVGVGITAIAAAANVPVLITLAFMNTHESRRAKQARELAATLTLGHALTIVVAIFGRLKSSQHDLGDRDDLGFP